jgi:tetratricopeptide (TPR) repeat protein
VARHSERHQGTDGRHPRLGPREDLLAQRGASVRAVILLGDALREAAARAPDAVAFIHGEQRLTYSGWNAASDAAARTLFQQALSTPTDRDADEARIRLAWVDARTDNATAAHTALDTAERRLRERRDNSLLPLLYLVRGEIAYRAHDLAGARTHFARASALWTDDLPDPESVEARAYVGLLDGLAGRRDQGRALIRQSLSKAEAMGHVALQAECKGFLSQIDKAPSQISSQRR